MEFPGKHKLIAAFDAAVRLGDEDAVTHALRHALVSLFADRELVLPRSLLQPIADHYARRELYLSPDLGYSVIAMTWGPGQGTPIHDHSGMWCVEGVWEGFLEVTPYELLETRDDQYRFESRGTMNAGPGSAGSLIPPHEYHTIRNSSDDAIAVSLHIYRGAMNACSVFQPTDAGWYARDERKLSLDHTR